jgi:hypothetical protein
MFVENLLCRTEGKDEDISNIRSLLCVVRLLETSLALLNEIV